MRLIPVLLLFLAISAAHPASAQESQPPAAIIEKMSFKLARGVTNVVTCIAELPKQTVLTVRERGGIGYVIGPMKGIGMTIYRGLMGGIETVFFLVPQPGYYDPMVNPEFVWHGWGEADSDAAVAKTE